MLRSVEELLFGEAEELRRAFSAAEPELVSDADHLLPTGRGYLQNSYILAVRQSAAGSPLICHVRRDVKIRRRGARAYDLSLAPTLYTAPYVP